jgi:site-specific DNA-methyltransferase (cytosine-N4-specific)
MPAILRGDARNLPLPDASVDLIVTSPPYFGLRSYTDGGEHYDGQLGAEASPREFVDALLACTREMVRVIKPTGSIFVNLGDKYSGAQGQTQTGIKGRRHVTDSAATWRQTDPRRTGIPNKSLMLLPERYRIACVDELGLIVRAVIVWSKPNGMPESATDRVRRSHEDWVHLVKQPRYFAAVDEIRNPPSGYFRPNGTGREARGGQKARKMLDAVNPPGRVPGSVWEIPTQPLRVPDHLDVDHFAAGPMEWPRRIIKGWCPPGGVVLDPFGGTGTTALVATMHGRHGISVDLSADYCRLAEWRATDAKERARAAGLDPDAVARISPEIPGQESIFDLFGGMAS